MDIPMISLNNGVQMPQLGLGVWQSSPEDTERAVRFAIDEAGYTLIDTAKAYRNEEAVGKAVRESAVPREELFITTKLWNDDHGSDEALAALDASLSRLGLDYVDLYLIHWPGDDEATEIATWHALEAALASGKTRAIGISNHDPRDIDRIVGLSGREGTGRYPAVNQIELHPHLPQRQMRIKNASHQIVTQSWSPLGGTSRQGWGRESKPNTLLDDPVIAALAERHGKSPAQVIIRWHLQQKIAVIPKSVHEDRIAENIDVFDFVLTPEDIDAIAGIALPGDTGRVGSPPHSA